MSIPICVNIKDEEVEISKTLDKNSIIEVISKYNKDLASEINQMNIFKIDKDDKRKCAWVLFKRCKIILAQNKVIYDMIDEKDFVEEYSKLNKLNSPQKMLNKI